MGGKGDREQGICLDCHGATSNPGAKRCLSCFGKWRSSKVKDRTAGAKGRIGSHQSEETKRKISESHKARFRNGAVPTAYRNRKRYELRENVFRSFWEYSYALYLDENKIEWEYEKRSFRVSDKWFYIPDFYLPKTDEYIEIKGRLFPDAEKKMKLAVKQYGINLIMLRSEDLEKLGVPLRA